MLVYTFPEVVRISFEKWQAASWRFITLRVSLVAKVIYNHAFLNEYCSIKFMLSKSEKKLVFLKQYRATLVCLRCFNSNDACLTYF